jgi:HK97 gp10 family phage protein
VAVQIFGLREFTRNLERFGAEASDLRDVFADISRKVEASAKAYAPKRTGAMAGRIRGSTRSKMRSRITVSGTRYHRYVHFGSIHNRPPRPFMFQAMDANVNVVDQMLVRGLNELSERIF